MHQEILHYFVHGRDKDWFEIRRDETKYLPLATNESHYGPWRLHYKRKVTKSILENSPNKVIHHHIKVRYCDKTFYSIILFIFVWHFVRSKRHKSRQLILGCRKKPQRSPPHRRTNIYPKYRIKWKWVHCKNLESRCPSS